jgi:DNA-binding response OmpR family regulator
VIKRLVKPDKQKTRAHDAERPSPAPDSRRARISLGNLTLELAAFRVRIGEDIIYLPMREFELLTMLASNPDSVIRQEVLTKTLWQASDKRELANLRVLVYRLKQRLSQAHPYRIRTVRGRGYGLLSEV